MKLNGKLNWVRVGAITGIAAGATGIGLAIYATHKVSGENGIDDLKKQLDKKSDINEDIIEMTDHLVLMSKYGGRLVGIQYQNRETKQMVGFQPIHFLDAHGATTQTATNTFEYSKDLNVYARLENRGEAFKGTLEADDKIIYTFKNGQDEVEAVQFQADHDGGYYEISTDHTNQNLTFKATGGTKLLLNKRASTSHKRAAPVITPNLLPANNFVEHANNIYVANKSELFPKGNVPSVKVTFINNKTYEQPTDNKIQEMMILKYYSHVEYAFSRGIAAGEAVFAWLEAQIKELEAKVDAAHPTP